MRSLQTLSTKKQRVNSRTTKQSHIHQVCALCKPFRQKKQYQNKTTKQSHSQLVRAVCKPFQQKKTWKHKITKQPTKQKASEFEQCANHFEKKNNIKTANKNTTK